MDPYIKLAKDTIKEYLATGKIIEPSQDLPRDMLEKQAGVFVCFKNKNELRGCIGTFMPTQENIAEEIINSTISAAIEDYRFIPVGTHELDNLKISIDILSQPEKVFDKDVEKLNPKIDGILVKSLDGFASGLLLPNLEGVDTVDEQLAIVCQKAGIDPLTEKIVVYKFTVTRHEEK